MICIYACLSTRPEIWCEVADIAYSPASGAFGIILTQRHAMCAASSLPRVRSAAVTWITRCCLLTFDEFERVMHAVKVFFRNTKTLGNNVLKLRTNAPS